MQLTDTLFYWLQTKRMTERRPEDEAARESLRYFAQILSDDHELESFETLNEGRDEGKIYVAYQVRGQAAKTAWFDREAVDQLANELYGAAGDSEHF
ncbi:hypothetical protein [Cohnella zeiphila]|uniref:Uncharacterized protein n=1 Tax=Cohnella zeiphila TaxID=2761120 RepID=A0A7X0SL04_9BACL|nr:hypothetical protein [Cohnella zeiphila]MBB6729678.1 hypothetical protein [Cohnella zeiphila]